MLDGFDAMSGDELFILVVSGVAGLVGMFIARVSSMPGLFTEGNPGIGLMRLAVAGAVAWTAFVIHFYGDPSIKGVYVVFYLVMAYGVTKVFGQVSAQVYGLRLRSDAYERKNPAVALFIATFTLATGIVFGGSLWGEADPLSDAEGGWWIPLGFFFMGWIILVLATALYVWREPGRLRRSLCQERDTALAWSVGVYMLSTSTLILEGVAGDFWGWRHGILGMGTIVLMLAGHEILMAVGRARPQSGVLRVLERGLYIALGVIVWLLNRIIDQSFTGG